MDDKLFTSALHEYYRDKFLANSAATHNDSWTLPYLSEHGAYIALHIDLDRSGYIRISEANTFTGTIPDGWTLPQWCAYKVAGI